MRRLKKMFVLSEKNCEYLKKLQKDHQLKYLSDTLDILIKEHEKNSDMTTEYIIKLIVEKVCEKIDSELLGIKRISNSSDKNIQVMLEMLNGMFFKQKYGDIVTTSEDKSPALKIAIEEVEKRITNNRVKRLDSKY